MPSSVIVLPTSATKPTISTNGKGKFFHANRSQRPFNLLSIPTGKTVLSGWSDIKGQPKAKAETIKEPEEAYLAAEDFTPDMFGTHYENTIAGEDLGLFPLYTLVSNQDDWDRYETLKWYAAYNYAEKDPDDNDLKEILDRIAHERTSYLRWGRDTVGWSLYLFRKPSMPTSN